MKQTAEDVFILKVFSLRDQRLPAEILIDSGTRSRLPHPPSTHESVLTARSRTIRPPGSSHRFASGWAYRLVQRSRHRRDGEPGEMMARMPRHWLSGSIGPVWAGPPHPVARRLREGDQVGSFVVIESPGHTAGHVSFWRESDRILILGDVIANLNIFSGMVMLREPERFFSLDPAQNRRSARRLIELEPKLVCFGHGPPLRDTQRFVDYVEKLPNP